MQKTRTGKLISFFAFLNEHHISYCVLGDSKTLPDKISSDIDIVINRSDFLTIKDKVYLFAQQYQCQLIQTFQHEKTACYFVLSFLDEDQKPDFIHPDICSDYYCNGKLLIKADMLLKGRRLALTADGSEKSFYIAAPEREFIYYLVKKIVKGGINQSQYEHLRYHYNICPDLCEQSLLEYWPKKEVQLVIKAMFEMDVCFLQKLFLGLQQILYKGQQFSLADKWHEFIRRVSRFTQPTGLVIAILGPDGAGKTAVGDKIKVKLSPAFRKIKSYHLRPYVIGNRGKKNNSPVSNPHGEAPRNIIESITKLLYFWIDYTFGYLFRIRLYKVKSTLVHFDRYYHDLLIDPLRYRYGAPMWLARLISRLIPKPDLFIILDAPAEVIYKRKQEVSFEEILRQREAYIEFSKSQANSVILNTDTSLEKTVEMACSGITEYMADRVKRRLGKG